ncbi:MAG: DUF1295 domain-containing protein [Bacteroidota bacterium]
MDQSLFNTLLLAWIGIAVLILPIATRIAAPYGRHSREGWGPMISNRMGWLIMELPALLTTIILTLAGNADKTNVIFAILGLWVLHYGHRTLIFPFMLKTKGKRMPMSIMFSAIFFNLVNGFFLGYYFGNFADYPDAWFTDPRFIGGLAIFFIGLAINWKADYKLINLRKPGEIGYKIPRGGLFEYISCPNHFGEIIEWAGFALLTWCLPALGFFAWTVANLIPRTLNHHKWYKEKFEDYPEERKAVIPFVL